jgi:hypothetical protein
LSSATRTSAHTRRTIVAIAVCAAAIATQAAILAGPDTTSATGIDHAVITDFVTYGVITPIIGQKFTMAISLCTAHVTAIAVGAVHRILPTIACTSLGADLGVIAHTTL